MSRFVAFLGSEAVLDEYGLPYFKSEAAARRAAKDMLEDLSSEDDSGKQYTWGEDNELSMKYFRVFTELPQRKK